MYQKQPKQHGALKPGFSNYSLNTPISEPCREIFSRLMASLRVGNVS